MPPNTPEDEDFARQTLAEVCGRRRDTPIVGALARGVSGAWYGVIHTSHPLASVLGFLIVVWRDAHDHEGTPCREYCVEYPGADDSPVDCPVALLDRYGEKHVAGVPAWVLACYAAAPIKSGRPRVWTGPRARVRRALDPATISPTLLLRWARDTDPLLHLALVRRADTTTAVLDQLARHNPSYELAGHIAAHPALTADLVGYFLTTHISDVILHALSRHPARRVLLAEHWELATIMGLAFDPVVAARVLLTEGCPLDTCVPAYAWERSCDDMRRVDPSYRETVPRVARALLLRRRITPDELLALLTVACRELRASDLPRIFCRAPRHLHAIVRSLLRASPDPALVAAITEPAR